MAGVAIIIPHERLHPAEDVTLGVFEGGGDDALELEGELIGRFPGVIVKLVADAVDEIISGLDFIAGVRGDDAVLDEGCQVGAAAFDPCHP